LRRSRKEADGENRLADFPDAKVVMDGMHASLSPAVALENGTISSLLLLMEMWLRQNKQLAGTFPFHELTKQKTKCLEE